MKKTLIILCFFLLTPLFISAQSFNMKTNFLYWATSTPNIGVEYAVGRHFTLALSGGYNPFNLPTYKNAEGEQVKPTIRHWVVMPEVKYWLCHSFEENYFSLYGIYGEYNIGGFKINKTIADVRYKGRVYGGGLSWGYQWAIAERWGLETSIGVGFMMFDYNKYCSEVCGDLEGRYNRFYVGPNKAMLSIIYYLK